MSDTYGEMLDKLVDRMAKFDERADIFRRNDIPKGHFYNVINPNKLTPTGNPFYSPIEWLVKLTRDAHDYCMIKRVAKDCGCICISPDEVAELKGSDHDKALAIIQKVIGLIK
jgi:hypothetical protein